MIPRSRGKRRSEKGERSKINPLQAEVEADTTFITIKTHKLDLEASIIGQKEKSALLCSV